MQAVSEDRGAAQLMGINVNATIALTFAIGSGLAAIAGRSVCVRLIRPLLHIQVPCLVSRHLWQRYLAVSDRSRELLSAAFF